MKTIRSTKHRRNNTEGELTCDFGGEGRAHDVVVSELDGDEVLSRHRGQVGDGAGTVLVVHALDLRLGGSLHCQGQATCTEKGRTDNKDPAMSLPIKDCPHQKTNLCLQSTLSEGSVPSLP